MKKQIRFFIALCVLFVSFAKAQKTGSNNTNSISEKDQKTIYHYSFTGTGNVEELRVAVLKLTDVTEVKSEYKPEKSAGQLRVVVTEKKRRLETDEGFSTIELKKLILQYNFQPFELKSQPFSEN